MGHIDLLSKFAYIEVPEEDAKRVMKALNGTEYKGRTVRCNDADEEGHGRAARGEGGRSERGGRGGRSSDRGSRSAKRGYGEDARGGRLERSSRGSRGAARSKKPRYNDDNGDWRDLIQGKPFKLKGEEPNFEEEGWARRRPKKK